MSEKEKRGNSQYTLFMVTQDLEYHIGKNAEEINRKTEELVGDNLEFCYTIVHNKDCSEKWNFQTKTYDAIPKSDHAHTVVKVKNKLTISSLANLLGLEPQYVEKPKTKGCNAKNNMLAYLIHAREPDKYQYDPSEVVGSKDAMPYTEVYARYKKEWDLDKAKARTKQTEIKVDELIEKIESEEIVDKNQILLTDEYYRCYSRHSSRIDKALEIASERRQAMNVQRIKEGNLKQVIFITGAPRKGKSYLTDQITQKISKEKNWLIGEGAVSNPFDDYNGEEIFVLDDSRGGTMRAEEWTRLLDPRKANRGSARFHNKMMSPQIIIFNCYKDVDEFFYFTKGIGENDKSEALDQFIGRILIRIVVHGPNDIDLSLSHERPNTRTIEFEDKYGDKEVKTIHTEHSFVTICEHQTNENIVALVAGLVCANQHAGRVTEAMMNAVSRINIPYNNVLLEDHQLKLEEKEKLLEKENLDRVEQAKKEEYELWLQKQKEKLNQTQRDRENQQIGKESLLSLPLEELLKLKDEFDSEKRLEDLFSNS